MFIPISQIFGVYVQAKTSIISYIHKFPGILQKCSSSDQLENDFFKKVFLELLNKLENFNYVELLDEYAEYHICFMAPGHWLGQEFFSTFLHI